MVPIWQKIKGNRTKMMVRHVVKLVKVKWCVLRIFFKLHSKIFFVLCNLNTGHCLFVCNPVHARLPAVGRKRHEAEQWHTEHAKQSTDLSVNNYI